ncbi:MAG: BON domain-containing protein [Acidobacteriota bacterium]
MIDRRRWFETGLDEPVGVLDQITCSIGIAANRLLAKIACKVDKPNGITIWHPHDMPAPLVQRALSDIPGVGDRMEARLAGLQITTIEGLLQTRPAQLRALWGSVNGERMWYALHGYAIQAEPTQRSMYGHGRVLPTDWRNIPKARDCSRLLLVKAARRMRRDNFAARQLVLWINGLKDGCTLTGEVNSQAKRTQAEKVAVAVPSVEQVVNELQVKGQKATTSH